MVPHWLRSLATRWNRTVSRPAPARKASRPRFEFLEDRVTPANLHWLGTTSTAWGTASNWQENAVPANGDVLFFDTTAGTVVNFTSNNNLAATVSIAGITINDAAATGFTITGNAINL